MFGVFSKTNDSNLIEAIGCSGLDFIIIDDEHGLCNYETIQNHIRALKNSETLSIIRVSNSHPSVISKALDLDPKGIQVPNIKSFEQAKDVVRSAKFYPMGERGLCRFVPSAQFGAEDKDNFLKESNSKLLILQVEGVEGITDLDKIIELEFDILFIGPYDLSQSLGFPGEVEHPEVQEAISAIATKAKEKGKRLGTFVDNVSSGKSYRDKGFDYVACSVDLYILQQALQGLKREYENE